MKVTATFFLLLLPVLFLSAQIIEKPRGCYAGTNGTGPNVLSHSEARGVLLIEKWSVLEPTPGTFDFSELDASIEMVTDAGLPYALAVSVGAFGYPEWLLSELGAAYHTFSYQGQEWNLPLWWDTTVSSRLQALISALGEHYAADTNLSHIYVSQMTTNGIEGHLNGVNMAAFASAGYTEERWIAAATSTTYQFADAFPDKPIVFEIHEIDQDTIVPAAIINELYADPDLCERVGLALWWLSGKTSYQTDLLTFIEHFPGDKYAQVIGRSDQLHRFQDSTYATVFEQAKQLGVRYMEPWPFEFSNHTHDDLLLDFNQWADLQFSNLDTCGAITNTEENSLADQGMSLFPNPTAGIFHIELATAPTDFTVLVFDSTGRKVLALDNSLTVDLSSYATGVYFIYLDGLSARIVKQE